MKIGIIGCGNMGGAIMRGVLKKGNFKPSEIITSDIDKEKLKILEDELKIKTTQNNLEVLNFADGIILAVKPFVMKGLLEQIKPGVKGHHIISIAAGINTGFIEENLNNPRVIRVMPNVACLVSYGISAIAKGRYADDSDVSFAKMIFSALGEVVEIDESLMDAVTALSGSGPAYIFLIIDALISVGVKMGLSRDTSERLVLATISGSVLMTKQTKKHPAELRDMVASPGGTTMAGIEVMEKENLSGILWKAVLAAEKRAKELG
ncbi:MAG: pyrroline-5-carboxylate reductase [bacterium]